MKIAVFLSRYETDRNRDRMVLNYQLGSYETISVESLGNGLEKTA
jgi:hypothetical protein